MPRTAKPKPIIMTRADFFKEHKHLIRLLNVGQSMVREAKSQSREMKKYK